MEYITVGKPVPRKEAFDKVNGTIKYNKDYYAPNVLFGALVTSTYAHAKIKFIDTSGALLVPGVKVVVTGKDSTIRTGTLLEDRPILAREKVRYYGEPVAVVVAENELQAKRGAEAVKVEYEQLPVVNSPSDAIKKGAPLVHEHIDQYGKVKASVYPLFNTNIADQTKIRKGDLAKGWSESEVVVEAEFKQPQSDHMAMETRSAIVETTPGGQIVIRTASQSPYVVRELFHRYFKVDEGSIIVKVPLVGGSFGGKAAVQLELIAYLASLAVNGLPVKVSNTRKEDMIASPVRAGLEGKVKFGAKRTGKITAVEITYLLDIGAYSDMGAVISKSIGSDCSGPYNFENLWCDSLGVYTNHPYVTSFRGFGHAVIAYCLERTMDKLAYHLGMDPVELRLINAISPGDTTPTLTRMTENNVGNIKKCIERARDLINWQEGIRFVNGEKVRAKGIAAFWKTSSTPPNAHSAVMLAFNPDGSINLNCGAVELGQGTKTTLAQILAEKLKMNVNKIHVPMEVNTQVNPEHWKTVASSTNFMVGRAVLDAAEDVIRQLKETAAVVLRCSPDDLDVGDERVYLKDDPELYVEFRDIVHGYMYPNGNSIGAQIIGTGKFIMRHLSALDFETGKGNSGLSWTVGAGAVEVEVDTRDYSYKILKAACVLDGGQVLNSTLAKGIAMGGMSMGLSVASREGFIYNEQGIIQNSDFITYQIISAGEEPQFLVDFVETPQINGPYGARGFGEHPLIGMPAALGNSLSNAVQIDLHQLPLTPENIWKAKTEGGLL